MLLEVFKKLHTAKWKQWVGTATLILILLVIAINGFLDGEFLKGVGGIATFGSAFLGIWLGVLVAFICKHLFGCSEDLRVRLMVTFGLFGFLFLPAVTGLLAKAYLNTEVEMHSIGTHFVVAFAMSMGLFIYISCASSDV